MYCTVPINVPRAVSCSCVSIVGSGPGASNLTSPKSSSLAPVFVSMTLPGFRSLWTIPRRCAFSSASAIWIAYVIA